MGILIGIIGLVAVNTLGYAAGWHVTDWQWWATVGPLCGLIGIAAASVHGR